MKWLDSMWMYTYLSLSKIDPSWFVISVVLSSWIWMGKLAACWPHLVPFCLDLISISGVIWAVIRYFGVLQDSGLDPMRFQYLTMSRRSRKIQVDSWRFCLVVSNCFIFIFIFIASCPHVVPGSKVSTAWRQRLQSFIFGVSTCVSTICDYVIDIQDIYSPIFVM